MPQQLSLNNFFLGGIADSKYIGAQNSVAEMVGLNIHAEPGVIKVNQKLTKESGATVDAAVSIMLPCSDGNTYLFSRDSGKIWKRTSGGTYSLEFTSANGAISGAVEYNGYVYFFNAAKVGRWLITAGPAAATDNWATFTVSTSYHPAVVKNGIAYIGDGYLLAQIDSSTGTPVFTADALDLPTQFIITALGEIQEDLLIGAFTATNVITTKIFRWNTYSVSWTSDDTVPEMKINAFIPADNFILVSAGQKGNLYTYSGAVLEQVKKIHGDWSGTNQGFVNFGAVCHQGGFSFFGLSNSSGNPAYQGVYSFGAFSSNYPKVLNLEYVISTGNKTGVEITAMAFAGDTLLVAWKDTTGGTTYGVDKVDLTAKYASAYFNTRVFLIDRSNQKDFSVAAGYRTLNGGTMTLKVSKNGGAFTAVTFTNDALRNLYRSENLAADANTIQFQIALVPAGGDANATPELEQVDIIF